MEPCAEAAKRGGGDNERNTYKNNSHSIQNKWNTYINILGQRIHSTHTYSHSRYSYAKFIELNKNRTQQTHKLRKKVLHARRVQQHKEEITMTHLMKADFQFYFIFFSHLFRFVRFHFFPCLSLSH